MAGDAAAAAARAHYRQQRALARRTMAIARKLWRLVDPMNISGSFGPLGIQLTAAVTAAQEQAAAEGAAYVSAAVAAQEAIPDAGGSVVASALAGIASDGRDLASLLGWPVIGAKRMLGDGAALPDAMGAAERQLMMMVGTQVADAGRVAAGVGMAADRAVAGYERVVTLPACSRCIILAGRAYPWSSGFQRHPLCDCVHVPVTHDEWRRDRPGNFPDRIFEQMSAFEQAKVFGKAAAEAIRAGADIGQVVNARRGMISAGGRRYTSEGITARGLAGKRLGQLAKVRGSRYRVSQIPRLMPEQIYAEAKRLGWDRDQVIRQLTRFGYIT